MRRVLWGALLFAWSVPALAQDKPKPEEPKTPADKVKAISGEFDEAQKAFSKAYQAAKTKEERQELFKTVYPRPDKYAPRFLKIAEESPKDPAAIDALIWVVQRASQSPEGGKAISILLNDHVTSEKLGSACTALVYVRTPEAMKLLREAREKNPHRDVKGLASYTLALQLKNRGQAGNDSAKEMEALLEEVAEKYADVKSFRGTLGEAAEKELFELRHLAVGKEAPDIEAGDMDGKNFKLSDYRGKVVLLDFWGHW